MIKTIDIRKKYGTLDVLRGVDLEVGAGEIVAIVGRSGAGKSTLMHILGALDTPDSGEIWIDGEALHKLNAERLTRFRNRSLGFVFQFHHLLPEFTALENASMPLLIAGERKQAAEKEALGLLGYLGLADRKDHKPGQLSGGEQQRVAIARALINKPRIILADEPTGNLDSQTSSDLHSLFLRLREDLGQTFLIVTHNAELSNLADRCLRMEDGRIIEHQK